MRMTTRTRTTLSSSLASTLAALALAAATIPRAATADDFSSWRGRGLRDATGSAMAKAAQPDWAAVFGQQSTPRSRLAGAPTIDVRRNYIYIQDTDGSLTIPYRSQNDLNESFDFVFQQIYATLPDEFVFIYMFTAFETGVGAFFYAPLVNTDSGIGQRRFNQGTGSRFLQGFVFMNDWQSFNQQFQGFPADIIQGFSRSVFNQEAGHRWGTQFEVGPGVGDGYLNQLLGRDEAHWSYFAHTGGSPMEGNDWRDNGNGTFTTQTNPRDFGYSDVDLYLMGLLPPAQVQPWFVINNPNVSGQRDIYNQQLGPSSPPQIFDPKTISGTRRDFTIQDLTSRLGNRSPAAGAAPTRWRVVFAMLGGRNNGLNENQRVQFERMVDLYAEGFSIGTRGLGSLDYELVAQPPRLPIGELCQMATQCADEAPICTRPAIGNDNVCTRACTNATGCPSGYCCAVGPDFGSNVCMPSAGCPVVVPDAGVAVDSGSATEADGGTGPGPGEDAGMSQPEVCVCDTTTACNENCACDPECPQPCACDIDTSCSADCACDPECKAPPLPVERSSCATTGAQPFALTLVLAAAALAFARRRKA